MRNFQDIFETRKRSFISAFSICMTVPVTLLWRVLYYIETSPLICSSNQWTGSYMAGISVMKDLNS